MNGGAGDDIYEVERAQDTVNEVLPGSGGTDVVRSTISYTLGTNVENLSLRGTANIDGTGNSGNNAIIGNSGANNLSGLDGNDVLFGDGGNDGLLGGNGNDELNGGLGGDSLVGGAGNDIYSYRIAAEGGDSISLFNSAEDNLAFSAVGFGGGLTSGEILVAGSTFIANSDPAPTAAVGTFLYDTDSGALSWDADGSNGGGAVLIVTLLGAPALMASDFLIV
jgi:Ca2+-binding RTX toxin-like protein